MSQRIMQRCKIFFVNQTGKNLLLKIYAANPKTIAAYEWDRYNSIIFLI
jgi:hypothetical protein